jgi:hypothetical protein
MQAYPRFTINRHLVILMPTQAALDWVNRVDPIPMNMTLAEMREEQNAYLAPELLDGQESAERWVQQRWKMFFETFLLEWFEDEALWPQKRTLKLFREWFEVQYHSMVWDMGAEKPIQYEDWESLER